MGPADDTSRPLASRSHFPLPKGFRPAAQVDWAHPTEDVPPFLSRNRRYTGRRAQGVRYERKAQDYLASLVGSADPAGLRPAVYLPSQWWRFSDCGSVRWCQTDGLFAQPREGLIIVVEIKYQHTPDAWFQLRELYEPVVRRAFGPAWTVALLEVVKWYDPSTFFPERHFLCADPLQPPTGGIGVHIWAP